MLNKTGVSSWWNWIESERGLEVGEHFARLFVWLFFGVLVGLLPVGVAWWIDEIKPSPRDYLRDFYWEGAFLFLGPAIVGALCAELTVTKTFFSDQLLSMVAFTEWFFVLLASVVTYAVIMGRRAEMAALGENSRDETMLTMIKEVSDAILISSAVFAFAVTAVLYDTH